MKRFTYAAVALLVANVASAQVINEFVLNHTGSDTNEFVEVLGLANADLSNLYILDIEGDGASAGIIDSVTRLGSTDANGYWSSGYLNGEWENGSISLLLVSNFSGAQGSDLDTNDDGVLDSTPWTSIIDSVAVSDGGVDDRAYTNVVLTPIFDGGAATVGGASRIPNGLDTDSVADWMRNDFDGAGIPGFTGSPISGEAFNTMGAVNQPVPEPATVTAFGIGLAALIRRNRKRAAR